MKLGREMSRQEIDTRDIRCPICESSKAQAMAIHGDYKILHCNVCDVVFTDPMKAEITVYERHASYIFRDVLLMDPSKSDYKWDMIEFLKDPPLRKGRLLDVGCGTGFFVRKAVDIGFDAYGIDFNERSIEAGKAHFGLKNLYTYDLSGLLARFPDMKFDVVTLFHVLEHLENPNNLIKEIKGCLEDRGVLVIAVPYRDRWPDFLSEYDLPPHHLTRWSPTAMQHFLELNGFYVSKQKIERFPPRRTSEFLYQYVAKIAPFLTLKGQGLDSTSHELSEEETDTLTATLSAISKEETERILKKSRRKKTIANILGFPIWLVLKLFGAKGPFLYTEARPKRLGDSVDTNTRP